MDKGNPSELTDIFTLLGEIKGTLEAMKGEQTKVMLALIALAGATLGLKVVGSPPLQVIIFYVKVWLFAFAVLIGLANRKHLRFWWVMSGYGVIAGGAQIIRLLSTKGTSLSSGLFLVSNVVLVGLFWSWDRHTKEALK